MWTDIEKIKNIIKESTNKSEVLRKINLKTNGGNFNTLSNFIENNDIDISHFTKKLNKERKEFSPQPLDYYLNKDKNIGSSILKMKLYKAGLKEPVCEKCGIDDNWNGEKISMILDHINGERNDNRLENLRILCPNCNATLDTHCRSSHENKYSVNDDKCKCGNYKKRTSKRCIKCVKTNSIKKTLKCECGNVCSYNSKVCIECYRKEPKKYYNNEYDGRHKKKRVSDRPSYETLRQEVIELGYCGTGRKYGVSDNAIRKWLKMYEKYGNNI